MIPCVARLSILLLPLVLALAGCATAGGDAVGAELVRVATEVLGTADSTDDARSVLRRELAAGPSAGVVQVAGHRFFLAPATLDRLEPPPSAGYAWLVAQSLELVEANCLPLRGPALEGWRAEAGGNGRLTLTASASGLQFVSVAIELRQGCVVALHVEQASSLPRQ